jgi:putative transferase (TIGR04331 family)
MFLATTSLENFWKKDTEILFLGEWCKVYSRKNQWIHLNSKTLPYHWDDREKLSNDFQYLLQVFEITLAALTNFLNQYHHENHSKRFWAIIIGPWLRCFLAVLYDRYYCLKLAENGYSDLETLITTNDFIPVDYDDFLENILSDNYNLILYSQILRSGITKISYSDTTGACPTKNIFRRQKRVKFWKRLFPQKWLFKLQSVLNNVCIYESYLPKLTQLNICKKLRIIPFLDASPKFIISSIENKLENKVRRVSKLVLEKRDDFHSLVSNLALRNLPYIYLEGYRELNKFCFSNFPKNPILIMTANGLYSNEAFKIWAAGHTETGTKLIITQHGGGYGTCKFMSNETHERDIADYFLTWGWKDKDKKAIPFYFIKQRNKTFSYQPKGRILLISVSYPRWSYALFSVPLSRQSLDYFETTFQFLKSLNKETLDLISFRLYYDRGWGERQKIKELFSTLHVEDITVPYEQSIKNSRLCLCTHNATTFLEIFQMNVPTLIYWNPKYFELRKEAQPYYDMLVNAGIMYYSSEQCAAKVNEVYKNPMSWWMTQKVQEARKDFCNQFARDTNQLTEEIVDLLKKLKKESLINRSNLSQKCHVS